MNRRDLLRLGGGAVLLSALPYPLQGAGWRRCGRVAAQQGLFFDESDLVRIRQNKHVPFLAPHFEQWAQVQPEEARAEMARVAESNELIRDFRASLEAIRRESLMVLLTGDWQRRDAVEYGIRTVLALPKWDYLLEAGEEVVGLQRAPLAVATLLFAREVLGEALDPELREAVLLNVAEKGCVPCYRALTGMANPAEVVGWTFDERHDLQYKIDMSRWPEILDGTNLKAIPAAGLGLGALALEGRDPRASGWLDQAVTSSREFLRLYSDDGSYFEGISYVDYAMRTLFVFLEAHYRVKGDVDWAQEINLPGLAEYVATMQAGWDAHTDTRDVINFSDARYSVRPGVSFWIANRANDELAQYTGHHFSEPPHWTDFLWYHPERSSSPPDARLKNRRLDLDWIVARTGWEPLDSVLAFRSGMPANHEHADRNSFLFKTNGERLLTDHFGAAYDWRQPGWLLRLTEAHNAVLIDGIGHQYHDGSEGVNAGLAEARIIAYEDAGDDVWWVSDATHGYALVDPAVQLVRRSMLFSKPGTIIILDEVRRDGAAPVQVRFHPDNRDLNARVELDGLHSFTIRRPAAVLYAKAVANREARVETNHLPLPEELGRFPFVEVATEAAESVKILSVLQAVPVTDNVAAPRIEIHQRDDGWAVDVEGRQFEVVTDGLQPSFRLT